ncbi:MAG: hypothetical protein AB1473_04745 [Thermodesulfobacteriota bacterium]
MKKISGRELAQDIKRGACTEEILAKYGIPEASLQKAINKLLETGLLQDSDLHAQLETLEPAPPVAPEAAWKCLQCGTGLESQFARCPTCEMAAEEPAATPQVRISAAAPSSREPADITPEVVRQKPRRFRFVAILTGALCAGVGALVVLYLFVNWMAEYRIGKSIPIVADRWGLKLECQSIGVNLLPGTVFLKQANVRDIRQKVTTSIEQIKVEISLWHTCKLVLGSKPERGRELEYVRSMDFTNIKTSEPESGNEVSVKSCVFKGESDNNPGAASLSFNDVNINVPLSRTERIMINAEQIKLEVSREAIVKFAQDSKRRYHSSKEPGEQIDADLLRMVVPEQYLASVDLVRAIKKIDVKNVNVLEPESGTQVSLKSYTFRLDGDENRRAFFVNLSEAALDAGLPETTDLLPALSFFVESLRLKGDFESAARLLNLDTVFVSSAGRLKLVGTFIVNKDAPQNTEIHHCRITVRDLSKEWARIFESMEGSTHVSQSRQGEDIIFELSGTLGQPKIAEAPCDCDKVAANASSQAAAAMQRLMAEVNDLAGKLDCSLVVESMADGNGFRYLAGLYYGFWGGSQKCCAVPVLIRLQQVDGRWEIQCAAPNGISPEAGDSYNVFRSSACDGKELPSTLQTGIVDAGNGKSTDWNRYPYQGLCYNESMIDSSTNDKTIRLRKPNSVHCDRVLAR